jgi:hypothetical protein
MRRCKKVTLRDEQRKTNKPRATITSIDPHNQNFEVKTINCPTDPFTLDGGADGNVSLPLPREKLSDYLDVGDEVEFKKVGKYSCKITSLTCEVLRFSRFKRDLNLILKRLDNGVHPLKRCIILSVPYFVLLSAKKNPQIINAINDATRITENNNEKC